MDKIEVVPAHKLEGKCQVRHLTDEAKIEEWIEHDDHFYINQEGDVDDLRPLKKRDFGYCGECRAGDDRAREQKERFMETNSKLVGMELFSGKDAMLYDPFLCYTGLLRCWWFGSRNELLKLC